MMKARLLSVGSVLLGLAVMGPTMLVGTANAAPWPERPAEEGWVHDVVCSSRYSATRNVGVQNLSSVTVMLAVRGMDCFDWSNTGNPTQMTGALLSGAQAAPTKWSLEPNRWARSHAFDLGFFVRKPGGHWAYRGDVRFALSPAGHGQVQGELLDRTNTGSTLRPHVEAGYWCRQVSLGRDPNQWRTRQEFTWRPINVGATSRLISIYSDGENLYAVRCGRNDSATD